MKLRGILFLLGLLFCIGLSAQDSLKQEDLGFSKEKWEEITEDVDYSNETPLEQPKTRKSEPRKRLWNYSPEWSTIALISILVAIIAIVIIIGIQNGWFQGKKIVTKSETKAELVELEDIKEIDLHQLLKQAIAEKRYRDAIRINYLLLLQQLDAGNWIKWKKQKTNFDYVRECRKHRFADDFKNITLFFESSWYGELEVTAADFDQLNQHYQLLSGELTKGGEHAK